MKKRILAIINTDKQFSEILSGSTWTLFARIVATSIGMVTGIIVARVYGADIIGIMSLLDTLAMLLSIITVLGTKTSLLRLIPEHIRKYSSLSAYIVYRKIQTMVITASLITTALLMLFNDFLTHTLFSKPHLSFLFYLLSIFIVARSAMDVNTSAIRGLRLNRTFAFMHLLPSLSKFLILVIATLVFSNQNIPVYSLFGSWLITAVLGAGIMHFSFNKRITNKNENINTLTYRDILDLSLPMLVSTSMAFIVTKTGLIILGIFRSESEVGYYAIAATLATLTAFMIQSVNAIAASKYSELFYSEQIDELFSVAKKSAKLIFWTTLPVLLVLLLFGDDIINLLYGSEFEIAYTSLIIIAIGQFVNSICGTTGIFLNMTGHQIALRNILTISASINIGLCFLLIPPFGIVGAAFAAMLSISFLNITSIFYIKYKFGRTVGYLPFAG